MLMTSLLYPLEAKVFHAGAPKVILDYSTDNLQSITLFFKAAIHDKKAKGVRTRSEQIDFCFSTKHWTTSAPQVQKKIAARPTPFTGISPKTALSSLNDLIFEAMGSKSDTADIVSCEEGVNSMEAKP
ncbi:hypothetical protein E8E11_003584 [Didymella keratinophila]|nr:hypothetical protein E8E11_003584 [Didymella keratinophila]